MAHAIPGLKVSKAEGVIPVEQHGDVREDAPGAADVSCMTETADNSVALPELVQRLVALVQQTAATDVSARGKADAARHGAVEDDVQVQQAREARLRGAPVPDVTQLERLRSAAVAEWLPGIDARASAKELDWRALWDEPDPVIDGAALAAVVLVCFRLSDPSKDHSSYSLHDQSHHHSEPRSYSKHYNSLHGKHQCVLDGY